MSARCHCCGGVPDTNDTIPRYCRFCRANCRLVASALILRAEGCPFLNGKKPPVVMIPTGVRTGVVATGTMYDDGSFEWRGRRRRNVPGG